MISYPVEHQALKLLILTEVSSLGLRQFLHKHVLISTLLST